MRNATFAAAMTAALSLTAGGMASALTLVPNPLPHAPQRSDRQAAPQSPQRAAPQSSQRAAPHSAHRSEPRSHAPDRRFDHRAYEHRSYDYRPFGPHRHYFVPAPVIVPRYFPPPVYYSPPVVYYSPAPYTESPTAYVERADNYWYYCVELRAYYPDVGQCPGPWEPVPAR